MATSAEAHRLLHAVRLTAEERKPAEPTLTGAARVGDVVLAAAFLEAGSEVDERSIGFSSPLQAAAGAGHLAMVEFLLSRGACPREKPGTVYSPLSAAAMHGHRAIVERLADSIGDLSAETGAAGRAATHGSLGCLHLLLERGAPLGEHVGHVLRMAALQGRFACVKLLLARGVDPRSHPDYRRDLFGEEIPAPYLPRQAALENGHVHVVALLDGAPVDEDAALAKEAKLGTPGSEMHRLARVLGRSGRPHDRKAADDDEPLVGEEREAAIARAVDAIRAGALAGDIDVAGPRGRPPLVEAAESGRTAIVAALLAKGARADASGDDGETALLAASRFGHAPTVERLLSAGSDVNARGADRLTPLLAAAGRGDLETVRLLLDAGADAAARVRGRSALGFAFGVHKDAIRALVEARLPKSADA